MIGGKRRRGKGGNWRERKIGKVGQNKKVI